MRWPPPPTTTVSSHPARTLRVLTCQLPARNHLRVVRSLLLVLPSLTVCQTSQDRQTARTPRSRPPLSVAPREPEPELSGLHSTANPHLMSEEVGTPAIGCRPFRVQSRTLFLLPLVRLLSILRPRHLETGWKPTAVFEKDLAQLPQGGYHALKSP